MVEFAAPIGLSGRGEISTVIHGDDSGLYVEFYRNPTDGLDHIKMMIPGDKTYMPDFIADERFQVRFARQWEAYKTQTDQFEGQVPLEEVAWIDEATRNHYKSIGIFTVDGLANVSDGNLTNLGPEARAFRDRARAEVENLEKIAAYDRSEAEKQEALETAAAEKQAMQDQIDELRGQIDTLTAPPKNKKTGSAKSATETANAP